MIGLTCSWAWSRGPRLCPPPPLCVLSPLIADGRRGAVSPFLSLSLSVLSPLVLSLSLSLCLLSLMTNLSAAPVVKALHGTEWYTQCFFPPPSWKHLCPVKCLGNPFSHHWQCPTQIEGFVFGDEGESSLCFTELSGSSLRLFAPRHSPRDAVFLRSQL